MAQPSVVSNQTKYVEDIFTAGNLHRAHLPVKRVELEVHWAGQSQGDSDAVQDVAVGKDSDVDIVDEDVVEVSSLLVPEESVRHPDLLGVCESEILHTSCKYHSSIYTRLPAWTLLKV